jgi:hypothetical protein
MYFCKSCGIGVSAANMVCLACSKTVMDAAPDLLEACRHAEQTLWTIGNKFHDFEARQTALKEAANLRIVIRAARGGR